MNLIGLCAGTAVAACTLEALPPNVQIADVFMLSGSVGSTHDLTPALHRVTGKRDIFTSQNDTVLQILVPISGTADRDATTTAAIGAEGPIVKAG